MNFNQVQNISLSCLCHNHSFLVSNILHEDVGKSFRHSNNRRCPYGCIYAIQKTEGRMHRTAIVNSEEELQLTLQYKTSS